MSRRELVASMVVVASVGLASPGWAFDLVDDGDTRLQLNGVAQAAYGFDEEATDVGAQLDLARLMARVGYADVGDLQLHAEARTGQMVLLDANVRVVPVEPVTVTLGRFKTPVSAEFLLPAPALLFRDRAFVSDLGHKRLDGGMVSVAPAFGAFKTRVEVGLFNPQGTSVVDGMDGHVLAGRLLLSYDAFSLHLAAADHIMGQDPGVAALEEAPVEQSLQLDAAIVVELKPVRLHVEAIRVERRVADETVWGGTTMAAVDVLETAGTEWEVAGGWDVEREDGLRNRATAGLNVYMHEHDVVASVEDQVTFEDDGQVNQLASVSVQVVF